MVKLLTRCGFVLFALVIALVIAGYAWLRSGPISNEELTKMLADALSAPDGSYTATVGEASLNWREFDELGKVRIESVVMRDGEGNIFANFPLLHATLNPLAWVIGGQKISELAVLRPQFYLQKDRDGQWVVGFGGEDQKRMPLAGILAPFSGDDHAKSGPGMRGFDRLLIYGAQLYVADEATGTMLSSTNATIRAKRSGSTIEMQLRAPMTYDNENTAIIAAAVIGNNGSSIASDFRLRKIPLALICKFADCPSGYGAEGTFTGRIAPGMLNGELGELTIQGVGENLKIDLPEWFEETLDVPRARIDASLLDGGNKADIRIVELTLAKDTVVRGRGKIYKEEAGYGADAYAETSAPLHVSNLRKYWPITAAADTRTWVNTMLSKGMVPSSYVYLTIKPGDLDHEDLPDSALRATVHTTGMSVKYLEGFPSVKNLDATVHFTGETLRVELIKGDFMSATKVNSGLLTCDNLNHPNIPMAVELGLDAAVSDVAKLLALEHFTFDDALGLKANEIKGRASGTLKLAFNSFSEALDDGKPHFENVKYDTKFTLHDIAQPNFAGAFNLSAFGGELVAREGLFTLKGNGAFDGYKLAVDIGQEGDAPMQAGIVGTLSAKAVRELAGENANWISDGTVGADVALNYTGGGIFVKKATIDATNAAIAIPEISFKKAVGEKGSIALKQTEKSAGALALNAKLGTLSANGTVRANTKTGDIEQVHIARVSAPGNDFSLNYTKKGSGFIVDLKGKQLDARDSYASTENSILADFPKMRLNLNLDSLLLHEIPFTQLHGHLDCLPGACISADISGIVGKGNISARIATNNAVRALEIQSGDAGDLLKALDITERMFDGKMQLTGTYDDSQEPAPLNARLMIHDFTLKNSEILARLFSIGSLSGLANALTGSGIAFDKIGAGIVAKQGIFKISDGQAKGNAMGFTVKGTVDTTKATLNLKGVLVPAFFLNSFIGNIPIIGEIAGGAGEGLIAFNYSIKGPYADPQTSVNPLSGLTPGFLRGIFSAFDAPADDVKPADAPADAKPVDPGQTPPPATPQPNVKRN